jgi:hypothetical protein|tara:strand:+ start:288 stop:488 length:201 start_codon:yes stop_codon:yes gene_type:complete
MKCINLKPMKNNTHPITGYVLVKHERKADLCFDYKYLSPSIVPRNEYGKEIQLRPFNYLTDNIKTA